jgi:phosphoadenosine phosphosulfate reductase
MNEINMQYQLDLMRGQPDDEAIRLIREYEAFALFLDPRGYCVCTSEGKDSRVLGHLMRRAGVKHFYLHNITGIDPPELVYFQRRNFGSYADMGYITIDAMYQLSMWQLMVKKLIPPLRHKRYCCEHLKERKIPEQGKAFLATGVRKAESVRRRLNRSELEHNYEAIIPYENALTEETYGYCDRKDLFVINPLAEWPHQYIWDYSKEAHLEQCCLYQEGFDRLGCIGCPMAGCEGRKREFARWPKFEAQYRRTFRRMHDVRMERGLMNLNNAKDPDEWFEWWLSDQSSEISEDDADQLFLEGFD